MLFHVSFKHMDSSPAMQTYAEQKLSERIQKFVTKPIATHVTFSVEKHHQNTVHVSFDAGDGFSIEVEHTCEDMHASVDAAADKLTTQLKKHKEKLKDHKGPRRPPQLLAGGNMEAEAVDAAEILKYEEGRKRAGGR